MTLALKESDFRQIPSEDFVEGMRSVLAGLRRKALEDDNLEVGSQN